MIKIVIVDDKRMMRLGICEKFKDQPDMKVLFMAENGSVFLEEMKKYLPHELPDIVLMDIDMPEMNGIEAVSFGKEIYPQVEYIMLTVFDEDEKIFEAIRAGATGYLLKDESTENLLQAIKNVYEFKSVPFSPTIARRALTLFSKFAASANIAPKIKTPLTGREIDVLKCLVDGDDYRLIAAKMDVSPNTVRNHISNIYAKLHITNRIDAVKIALKNNWV
jgi:DNA-binding NarL/FixJ family response regulator